MIDQRNRVLLSVLAGVLVAAAFLVVGWWLGIVVFVGYLALLTAKRPRP